MKRIQEKVKDIVEVRDFRSLQDFIADPAQTLSGYHFTDVTSDLMAKWLDRAAGVQVQNGAACALAGYRGVGKSHFLAALGAILANPELRSRVTDSHVAAGAQLLKRRHYPVAYVRRGSHATLLDELKDAIATVFEIDPGELGNSLPELLANAADRAGELPFVLMIDTAFGRDARVSRDDGIFLGEMAAAANELNVFIGVALDDDIAGADGVNAAIVRSFSIDYLDQEHLYKIVDAHVFPKHRQMLPLLHDIYNEFREVLPSFRWSEQRFSSLYPLHPVTLEIAPFVRLYVQDFALLGFASEAGAKILGRPANSLIGLDEVFDRVETNLRKTDELKEVFAAYDNLNTDVVGQIPVMQRLQAKLILKALLLLSLDGNGTTASDISAAMLIFDENDPEKALKNVEELVETFASKLPDGMNRTVEEGREIRYGFRISGKDGLNKALAEAIKEVSPEAVTQVLKRVMRGKYSDCTFPEETEAGKPDLMDCHTAWRGGLRRGYVFWQTGSADVQPAAAPEFLDWEMFIGFEDETPVSSGTDDIPRVYWQAGALVRDEIDTLLRYYVLLTRSDLREEYGEQVRAAGHAHAIAAEKIWSRSFLQDGKLVIDGFDYNLTEDARTAESLSKIFAIMLEPLFETRFPAHPYFTQQLGMTEVSTLVKDFFSGSKQNLAEVQKMAETFALPLGLVDRRGEVYIPESEENLLALPVVAEVVSLLNEVGDDTVSLRSVYSLLKKGPNGLVHEAQHLILTAMVAQRLIEFVTTKGDRINRRSLDLKIIWDDIEGIARPAGAAYSSERLTDWARTFCGTTAFASIENAEDRDAIRAALEKWLAEWRSESLLERFEALPDEILNTRIWRLATHMEKTFGMVAETVASMLDNTISLDEGLHRIADSFSDSEEEYKTSIENSTVLRDFINGTDRREEIKTYLSVCEITQDEKIEQLRERLLQSIDDNYSAPSEALNNEMGSLWRSFQAAFSEYFAVSHDMVMKSHYLQEKFEEIMQSDPWWAFEKLSQIPVFQHSYWTEVQKMCRRFRQLDCKFEVREMLKTHPFCACSFNLSQIEEWETLPDQLSLKIDKGLLSYRKGLVMLRQTLTPMLEQFSKEIGDRELADAARNLAKLLQDGKGLAKFSNTDLTVLERVFASMKTTLLVDLSAPKAGDYMDREELRQKLNHWVDELPGAPVLVKI
jgi:hypothetical protein